MQKISDFYPLQDVGIKYINKFIISGWLHAFEFYIPDRIFQSTANINKHVELILASLSTVYLCMILFLIKDENIQVITIIHNSIYIR